MEALHQDHDWILLVGVVHIMDRLTKYPEFTGGVSQIRHTTFVVGEKSGRVGC